MSLYSLFSLFQLAFPWKLLRQLTYQSACLGIPYIVCSCVFLAYVKLIKKISLNSTEFLYLHPKNAISFFLSDKLPDLYLLEKDANEHSL